MGDGGTKDKHQGPSTKSHSQSRKRKRRWIQTVAYASGSEFLRIHESPDCVHFFNFSSRNLIVSSVVSAPAEPFQPCPSPGTSTSFTDTPTSLSFAANCRDCSIGTTKSFVPWKIRNGGAALETYLIGEAFSCAIGFSSNFAPMNGPSMPRWAVASFANAGRSVGPK